MEGVGTVLQVLRALAYWRLRKFRSWVITETDHLRAVSDLGFVVVCAVEKAEDEVERENFGGAQVVATEALRARADQLVTVDCVTSVSNRELSMSRLRAAVEVVD